MITLKLCCLILAVVNLIQRVQVRKLREENEAMRYGFQRMVKYVKTESKEQLKTAA